MKIKATALVTLIVSWPLIGHNLNSIDGCARSEIGSGARNGGHSESGTSDCELGVVAGAAVRLQQCTGKVGVRRVVCGDAGRCDSGPADLVGVPVAAFQF